MRPTPYIVYFRFTKILPRSAYYPKLKPSDIIRQFE